MLTPQEVSEKVFPKSSGFGSGYAMGAVDEFLDALTEDYTALYKENVTLKAKLKILAEKVEEYRATEDAMRSTLLTAQKMAAKLVQEAQTEKDNMLKEAREQHAAQLAQLEKDKQEAEDKLVMAKQSLVDFVRHGSELCAQQQEFLNSLPEMQLSAEEAPADAVTDIQQDIMQHMDAMETAAAEPEEPAVKDVPAGSAIPNDFKLSLDELKFGRNYTGE
jgi:cell division initiation protein